MSTNQCQRYTYLQSYMYITKKATITTQAAPNQKALHSCISSSQTLHFLISDVLLLRLSAAGGEHDAAPRAADSARELPVGRV